MRPNFRATVSDAQQSRCRQNIDTWKVSKWLPGVVILCYVRLAVQAQSAAKSGHAAEGGGLPASPMCSTDRTAIRRSKTIAYTHLLDLGRQGHRYPLGSIEGGKSRALPLFHGCHGKKCALGTDQSRIPQCGEQYAMPFIDAYLKLCYWGADEKRILC